MQQLGNQQSTNHLWTVQIQNWKKRDTPLPGNHKNPVAGNFGSYRIHFRYHNPRAAPSCHALSVILGVEYTIQLAL